MMAGTRQTRTLSIRWNFRSRNREHRTRLMSCRCLSQRLCQSSASISNGEKLTETLLMIWQNRQDHLYKQILICERDLRLYGALKGERTTMMLTCSSSLLSPRVSDWCQPRHVEQTSINRQILLIQRYCITLIYLIKWGCTKKKKKKNGTALWGRALE